MKKRILSPLLALTLCLGLLYFVPAISIRPGESRDVTVQYTVPEGRNPLPQRGQEPVRHLGQPQPCGV